MKSDEELQTGGSSGKLLGAAMLIGLSMGMVVTGPAAAQASVAVKADGRAPTKADVVEVTPVISWAKMEGKVVGSTFKKVDGKALPKSGASGVVGGGTPSPTPSAIHGSTAIVPILATPKAPSATDTPSKTAPKVVGVPGAPK